MKEKNIKKTAQPMAKIFLFKKAINIFFCFSLFNFRKWSIGIQTYESKKKEREREIGKKRQTEWMKERKSSHRGQKKKVIEWEKQ